MKTITLNDATLSVTDVGTGPVLLLVHGFPLNHSMWQYQIDELSSDFRVIAPDLRGFGKSTGAGNVVTMEQFADDLGHLLHALAVTEPVNFCGLSMGGYIGWQFWKRHASSLGKLILCDTRAAADSEEVARGRRITAEGVLANGTADLAESMPSKLFSDVTLRDNTAIVEATRKVIEATKPVSVAGALCGMAKRPDMTSELGRIDVPTLVICGSEDAISPVAEMRAFASEMPNATFVEVPNAGHMSPLENPTVVNAAIREFAL